MIDAHLTGLPGAWWSCEGSPGKSELMKQAHCDCRKSHCSIRRSILDPFSIAFLMILLASITICIQRQFWMLSCLWSSSWHSISIKVAVLGCQGFADWNKSLVRQLVLVITFSTYSSNNWSLQKGRNRKRGNTGFCSQSCYWLDVPFLEEENAKISRVCIQYWHFWMILCYCLYGCNFVPEFRFFKRMAIIYTIL